MPEGRFVWHLCEERRGDTTVYLVTDKETPKAREFFTFDKNDAEWLQNYLGADGFVKLFCRTEGCPGKGGWIRRSIEDMKKNRYTCEAGCGEEMKR
jgi:hypothetical protein